MSKAEQRKKTSQISATEGILGKVHWADYSLVPTIHRTATAESNKVASEP